MLRGGGCSTCGAVGCWVIRLDTDPETDRCLSCAFDWTHDHAHGLRNQVGDFAANLPFATRRGAKP